MNHPTPDLNKKTFEHYLRTGQRILPAESSIPQHKKDKNRESLRRFIIATFGRPHEKLVDHYFYQNGQTYNLVSQGLLKYITRSRAFKRAKSRFIKDIRLTLKEEARKRCEKQPANANLKFNKRFKDRTPIDFTLEFFSLGNSYLNIEASSSVDVNCHLREANLTAKLSFKINDEFIDAADFFDLREGNQEFEGGTPFKMVAHWSETYQTAEPF